MSVSMFSSRRSCLALPLLALVFAAPALAVEPVDMGNAHDYSVLASTLTSNGATAMSDNLGVWPATTLAGDTAPIVLGETHLGDTQAEAAKASLDEAYGDAVVRGDAVPLPANLAGQSFGPGVYNTTGAMGFTASGVLTLDAQGDPDAVFIFQIGAALTIGASARVALTGGAEACNVFWAVGGAATIGATANFAGTLMANSSIGVGAGSRVDGRVLSRGPATLASNAIRTACTETVVVPGPAGPPGAPGTDGIDGTNGIDGADGADGATGATGPTGLTGVQGPTGANGLTGLTGLTGLMGNPGLMGVDGLIGPAGPSGPSGPAGPPGVAPVADTTTLCVTNRASRRKVRQGGLVGWTVAVKNCGERAASGVSVTNRLGAGASFKTRGGGTLIRRRLGWKTGTLAPGARKIYKVTTRFSSNSRPGLYVNRATADADNTRPASGQGWTTVTSEG